MRRATRVRGQRFVAVVDHVVTSVETLPASERPVCWFLGGAALLNIGDTGRRGVDLAPIRKTYWPHAENFLRLQSSSGLAAALPRSMVEDPRVGLARLRVSVDRLPVEIPGAATWLPDHLLVPLFTERLPEMIVPYADAAALMLNDLEPGSDMSCHRIGLALPIGMRGEGAHRNGGQWLNAIVSVEAARAGRPLTTIGSAVPTSVAFDRSP